MSEPSIETFTFECDPVIAVVRSTHEEVIITGGVERIYPGFTHNSFVTPEGDEIFDNALYFPGEMPEWKPVEDD